MNSETSNPLGALSRALTACVASTRPHVAAIATHDDRHVSAILWRAGVVVASEQSLPQRDACRVVLAGGRRVEARVAGRDPGTNIAVLRLAEESPSFAPLPAGSLDAGGLVLALGADGAGDATVRLGIVHALGPDWVSTAGGRIDRRITLDLRLERAEEGGPVVDADGGWVGMSTFGPRGRVIAIPRETIERIAPRLLEDGHVPRGWLGVSLQPVAVPESLHADAAQTSGLMVMSIADNGPSAKAGVVAGDIVLSLDGVPAQRLRRVSAQLGPESVGRDADLRLIRAGRVMSVPVRIEARPAE